MPEQQVESKMYWRKRMLIAALLGIVTTILVALGFALVGFLVFDLEESWSDTSEYQNWRRRVDPFALPEEAMAKGSIGWCWADWWATSLSPVLQQKIQQHPTLSEGDREPNEMYEFQTGWPMPALSGQGHNAFCEYVKSIDPPETDVEHIWASNGILFLSGSADDLYVWEPSVIALPFVPIWIGFTLDSMFFGSLWFASLFIYGPVRRFSRVARGACPACGYNLHQEWTKGCPECGWNRLNNKPETTAP